MATHSSETTHGHEGGTAHHVTSSRLLIMNGAALLVLTIITVAVSYFDLGALSDVVALTIAAIKAVLIIFIFMGLRWSTQIPRLISLTGLFMLLLLIIATLSEMLTRVWIPIPGH